jgi:hypothetical protein
MTRSGQDMEMKVASTSVVHIILSLFSRLIGCISGEGGGGHVRVETRTNYLLTICN